MHLGIGDEDQINNMSYVFFNKVLGALGHKLVYDAVVNYAGNSFCEKSWEMIMDHYPLEVHDIKHASAKAAIEMFRKNASKIEERIVPRPVKVIIKETKENDESGMG